METEQINPQEEKQDLQQQKKKFERIIQKLFSIENNRLLDIKHQECKHRNGCITQLIDLSLKGFSIGMGIKVITTALQQLIKSKNKNIIYILYSILKDKKTYEFAVTPLVYNLVLQGVTCLLKWKHDKTRKQDAFYAGFLAGFLALLTKPQQNRKLWALFLLTRAIECMYNNLVNKKYILDTGYNYVLIFASMWGFLGIMSAQEQGNLPKSFLKFENIFMNMDSGDITLYRAQMQKVNKQLYLRHRAAPFDYLKIQPKPTKQVRLFKNITE